MIRDYADHAASERTFLAWLRTGIAVVAFGFLIEKFDLFALTMEGATPSTRRGVRISKNFRGRLVSAPGTRSLSSAFSSYWRAIRFVRTGRLLDDQAMHSPGILPDLAFGVTLALLLKDRTRRSG